MKVFFTYGLCFIISLFLLGAQIAPCYNYLFDFEIELQENNEENPVEDISDKELEEEKELRNQSLSLLVPDHEYNRALLNQVLILQSPDKDVLSPPPDYK